MKDLIDLINEELPKFIDNNIKNTNELIEQARLSIKHPHFYYAIIDTQTNTITYKKKKWYKWFSGKRIVAIKVSQFEVN